MYPLRAMMVGFPTALNILKVFKIINEFPTSWKYFNVEQWIFI